MSDIKIITGLEDILIAFKEGSNYGENYIFDTAKTATAVTNRATQYINTRSGKKEVNNKIEDIDLELEIYSINTPALAKLQGATIDANGGYIIRKDNKSSRCAVSLVRTDNFGNREFITYYNCLVTLNALEAETTGENVNVQAYKLSVKCLGDNGNMQYFVREEDLPIGSNFIDNFYSRVYIC
ncbi:phage tail protein [Sarcina ventriculi]|uniref:phage tail protein n=1 Tax=Sarcina ventriculi TaxID=1267 RepID=UPI0018ABDA98|nr:phage tail protein [Sarcina ventriculi]